MTDLHSDAVPELKRAQLAFDQGHPEAGLLLCQTILMHNAFSVNALSLVSDFWLVKRIPRIRLWILQARLWCFKRLYCGQPHKLLALAQDCLLNGMVKESVYQLLADSASTLQAWSVARFALELLVQKVPGSLDYPLALARVCLMQGDFNAALTWIDSVLTRAPAHLEAQALCRETAVRQAMAQTFRLEAENGT
jgi:hypothetical protein